MIVIFSSPPMSPISGTKKRPPGVPPGVPPTLTDEEKDDDDYEDDSSDGEIGNQFYWTITINIIIKYLLTF